jgi:phosphatidylglycerophosphate synthase
MINYYSGLDGKGDIPSFALILFGISYLCYHYLDVLDGKHARQTGTSSALGMLMDHGCDALTTFLITMSLGSVIKLGR